MLILHFCFWVVVFVSQPILLLEIPQCLLYGLHDVGLYLGSCVSFWAAGSNRSM